MSEFETSINSPDIVDQVCKELEVKVTDKLFRYMHPVMISGIEDGYLLLRGLKSDGSAVIDKYTRRENSERRQKSSLENPGLNFSVRFSPNYRNKDRRLAVSLKIADQPNGLKVYQDTGSEIKSVYLTLPEGTFFKVSLETGDTEEVGMAIRIHQLMEKLSVVHEPEYLNWVESGDGVRIAFYLKKEGDAEEWAEITFYKNGNTYKAEMPQTSVGIDRDDLLKMATFRLMLEDKDFDAVISDNTNLKVSDLLAEVHQIPGVNNI